MPDKKKLPRYPARCRSCGYDFEGEDPPPRRQCSRDTCEHEWVPDHVDDARNCPECNNPFTRRLEDAVCPQCEEVVDELADDEPDEEEADAMPATTPVPTPAASPPPPAAPPVPRRGATTEDIWTISPGDLHRITEHPAIGMFPVMTPEEYEGVKADVLANGFLEPVKMTAARVLVEGRHRLRIARELALPLPAVGVRSDLTPAEITAVVVSANLHRRHLTADQKAAIFAQFELKEPAVAAALIGADVATMKAEAQESQRAGLKEGEESRGHPGMLTGKTSVRLAEKLQSTQSAVERTQKLKREQPALLDKVVKGELSAKQALSGTRPAKTKTTKTAGTKPGPDSPITQLRQIRGQLPDRLIEVCTTFEAMLRKEHDSFREVFIEYLPCLLACVRSTWIGR